MNYARAIGLHAAATVAMLLFASPAAALEPVARQAVEPAAAKRWSVTSLKPLQPASSNALDMLRSKARKVHARKRATVTRSARRPLLRVESSSLPPMIRKMKELECLPLLKVNDNNDSKVYFGIGFDGVVGFHGKL